MSQDDPQPNVVAFRPIEGPTIRVDQTQIALDGGAFILYLAENRRLGIISGRPVENVLVEVARVTLSPTTMYWLRHNINEAIATYERAMGHPLPDPREIGSRLVADAAQGLLRQNGSA